MKKEFGYIRIDEIDSYYIELAFRIARVIVLNSFDVVLLTCSLHIMLREYVIVELQESPEFNRGDNFVYK